MENSFASIIESANSILILLPTKPRFDQVAAALSLFLSLKDRKNTAISCPSPMLVEFNRLIGVDKISTELGNKNLSIKFSNYNASDIERVSYDIENGEFKLTVIPKSGFSSPEKSQVELSYSGISADVLVLVGGGNISHFPTLSANDFSRAKIVHLGTRGLSQGEVISFARPASSVSEIIASLIEESGFYLDADIATNLLAGIEEASTDFKSSEVTADTFQIVVNLMKAGGRRALIQGKTVVSNYPPGSIPGQRSLRTTDEEPPHPADEKPRDQGGKPPKDWLGPKIYKGTTIS